MLCLQGLRVSNLLQVVLRLYCIQMLTSNSSMLFGLLNYSLLNLLLRSWQGSFSLCVNRLHLRCVFMWHVGFLVTVIWPRVKHCPSRVFLPVLWWPFTLPHGVKVHSTRGMVTPHRFCLVGYLWAISAMWPVSHSCDFFLVTLPSLLGQRYTSVLRVHSSKVAAFWDGHICTKQYRVYQNGHWTK